MKIPRARWADTAQSADTVFIAQLAYELLDDFAWDSYRVYSLDLLARLHEALEVINDVQQQRIAKKAINPIVDEIIWSIEDDPIIAAVPSIDIKFTIEILNKRRNSLRDLTQQIHFLIRIIGPLYKAECEKEIRTLCGTRNRRIKLRAVVAAYIAHLINVGYDRRYLRNGIKYLFFGNEVNVIDPRKINTFFRLFDGSKNQYRIFAKIDGSFAQAATRMRLGKVISKEEIPGQNRYNKKPFFELGKRNRFLTMKLDDYLDPYGAREFADRLLVAGQAILLNSPHSIKTNWDDEMYVIKGRQTKGAFLDKPSLPLHRRKKVSHKSAITYSEYLAKNMFSLFNHRSSERLLRSINTSALARTSSNMENQIVSLWSAVEVLLSEPNIETPRILHYTELIKPCVCLRYVRRHIVRLFDQIEEIYGSSFHKVLKKETNGGGDYYTRFATILMIENRNELRDELCKLCERNPLALHKMWRIYRSMSSPMKIRQFVESHEKRVEWQIHRIYRARNNLVHTGRTVQFAESILMNLDEYFRCTIGTIMRYAERAGHDLDIDHIVGEVVIRYQHYLYLLEKKSKTDRIEISEMSEYFN